MTNPEAKEWMKGKIVTDAFKEQELKELAVITQSSMRWLFDFKGLTMQKKFLEAFVTLFEESFKDVPEFQVCGMESGALPLVAAIAMHSPKCRNAFYIRKSRKKHDLANLVEGAPLPGIPIILVDDILNRGNTFTKQMVILRGQGYTVSACFALLRFRDLEVYEDALGDAMRVESVFEVNDFNEKLNIVNVTQDTKDNSHLYNKWTHTWRVTLSKYNPYYVVPKSAPVMDAETVYMGSDDGYMRAISKETGQVLWEHSIDFGVAGKRILSSPALRDGKIFFGAYDGNFYCLDAKTGKRLWVFLDGDWVGASPSVSEDGQTVYIGLEFGLFKKQGGVAAIDIKTGKAKWTYYEMTGLTHASPAVNTKLGVVVSGCNDKFIYCLDRKTGNLKWKFETKGEVKYSAVFDEKRKLVIIAGMDGGVYCIHTETGELYHRFSAFSGFYSNPLLYKDMIIIGSLDKNIYCYDLVQKKEIWHRATRGRIFASPARLDDRIFIGSNDGVLYELDVMTGSAQTLTVFTERIVNKICVGIEKGKRVLYVPTHACQLYKLIERD